ncbi:MAG: FAD:protein FMN transferase [Rubrivivax sp.]|nr:MAG: FAD:protein FMN transferase [Rubrivivax sp.]
MNETRRMRPLLGTFVEVCARGGDATQAAVDAAFASIQRAHSLWSFQDPDSELSRLNAAPGLAMAVQADTLRLLRIAKALMQLSDGHFDCTVGGMLVQAGALPDHGGPPALPRGCLDDIELRGHEVRLRRPVRITLDGLAKGYAVDLAIRALKRQGARAGWVNAGGDLRAFGDLTLPLQRRELDGRFTPLGGLREAAMASSRGTASLSADEDFPACIVAPDGQQTPIGIWTVLARSAWRADALTKVAATAPAAQRDALVRRLGGQLLAPQPVPMAQEEVPA